MSPSRFLVVLASVCVAVTFLFSLKAAIFGLCVIGFAILIFSFEPITSCILAVIALIAIAVFVDPIVAAGATVVALISGLYGLFILVAKSSRDAKRVKRTSNQDL